MASNRLMRFIVLTFHDKFVCYLQAENLDAAVDQYNWLHRRDPDFYVEGVSITRVYTGTRSCCNF